MFDVDLKEFLLKDKKLVYLGVTVLVIINASLVILLVGLINKMTGSSLESVSHSSVLFFMVTLLAAVIVGISAYMSLGKIGQEIIYKIRLLLINRVLATDLESLESIGGHKIYSSVTQDVDAISQSVSVFPVVITNAIIVMGAMFYMAIMSFWLFLCLVAFIFTGVLIFRLIAKYAEKYMILTRAQQDQLYRNYDALIYGAKEIKLNTVLRRNFIENRIKSTLNSVRSLAVKAQIFWSFAINWASTLLFLAILMVLVIGNNYLLLPAEVLVSYIIVLFFLQSPVGVLLELVPRLYQGIVSLNKVNSLKLSGISPATWQYLDVDEIGLNAWKSVNMIDVEYEYPGEKDKHKFHFGPINMHIRAGEIVFVIGGNGSGKSTFMKLLAGLYQPKSGTVLLNGESLCTVGKDRLRNHYSAVFGDYYLFDDVLDRNGSQVNNKDIQSLLKLLELEGKVSVEQGRWSTTKLSQGQRRRLALVSAFLSDRPIYLFDEWAADQDPYFKSCFYKVILPKLKAKGKTIIVISHDDSYFSVADRVYKLDSGKIQECMV